MGEKNICKINWGLFKPVCGISAVKVLTTYDNRWYCNIIFLSAVVDLNLFYLAEFPSDGPHQNNIPGEV